MGHDWNLTVHLDSRGRGSLKINGREIPLSDKSALDVAKKQIREEFLKFEKEFVSGPGAGAFRGVIDMGGKRVRFEDSREFENARRQANRQMQGLQEILEHFQPEEILRRGIRSSNGTFRIGNGTHSGSASGGFQFGSGSFGVTGKSEGSTQDAKRDFTDPGTK